MAINSNLIEDIQRGSGKYDLDKKYFVNNASDEDIEVSWGAKEPEAKGAGKYLIKAGEMGGPYPQFLAYHIVKVLVNREMQKNKQGHLFASAQHRAPFEQKFLKEAEGTGEDSVLKEIREQERRKLMEELKKEPISEGPYTSSETRRKAFGKASHTDEFKGANKD